MSHAVVVTVVVVAAAVAVAVAVAVVLYALFPHRLAVKLWPSAANAAASSNSIER